MMCLMVQVRGMVKIMGYSVKKMLMLLRSRRKFKYVESDNVIRAVSNKKFAPQS